MLGSEQYLKLSNGAELYSVTANYYSYEFKGTIEVDKNESIDVKFFKLNQLPEGTTEEYIKPYIHLLTK